MSNIDTSRAAYRVLAVSGFFGPDDHLYELDSELYFDGEPNEELEPLNEVARERLNTYLEKLDALGREAAAKVGKSYAGRPRTFDGALELASAVQRSETAIMGHLKSKNVTSVERIGAEPIPETGSIRPRGKPGRPPKVALGTLAVA